MEINRDRNELIIYFIVFAIVAVLVSIPVNIMHYQSLKDLGIVGLQLENVGVDTASLAEKINDDVVSVQIASALCSLAMLYAYYLILVWKRSGIYLLFIASVVNGLLVWYFGTGIQEEYSKFGLLYEISLLEVVSIALIPTLFMGFLLSLKKNGVRCWALME
jgi:hypothetical protein